MLNTSSPTLPIVRTGARSPSERRASGGALTRKPPAPSPNRTAVSGDAAGDAEAALFGEGPGGFVVSGETGALEQLATRAPMHKLGTVGGDALRIALPAEATVSATLAELKAAHGALAELFG